MRDATIRGGIFDHGKAWRIAVEATRHAPLGDHQEIVCERIVDLLQQLDTTTKLGEDGEAIRAQLTNIADWLDAYDSDARNA